MTKTVFLTGASSGIGRALAPELAARGYDLVLAARRTDSLEQVRQDIAARHPQRRVETRALDVTRYDEVQAAIAETAHAPGGLDLVIANAGIGSTGLIGKGHFDEDRRVIETNVLGAMATIDAAVAQFRAQNRGQIVVISSVAAYRGMPGAGSYCASKAAIAVYADAARGELHGTPIRVTTLFPGYIDTPINEDMKSRPFLIDVTRGARIVADLIERGVETSTVPVMPWSLIGPLLRMLPMGMLARSAKGALPGGGN
ncbi:MAG: SDR family oxidoreductase [Nevskia sp.]|nr:SDR family oxidoreductase [Nevskia sp.]